MADERLLRVEGLADLQRAFRVADRRIANDFRKELREAAEPVRAAAEQLAVQEITRVGPNWSRMRVGVTRTSVYVAPRERGAQGRGNRRLRRPRFKDLMLDRAMEPALDRNIGRVEDNIEDLLARMARDWETA